jgi:hypothetical protein
MQKASTLYGTLLAAAFSAVAFIFSWIPVMAADWALSPSISVIETYDSNLRFSADDEESDFVSAVKPKVSLSGETDRSRLRLDSVLVGEKYIDNSDLDTIYTDNRLNLSHKWTQRIETALNADFIRDSSLETELLEAGIRTIRADRYRYNGGLTQKYALTESVLLSMGASAGETIYPDEELPDIQRWEANLNPQWAITERDTLGSNIYYQNYDYSNSSTIQYLGGLLFWERKLSETLTFNAGAGYRFTWIEAPILTLELDPRTGFRIVRRTEESTDDGLIFLAAIDKKWSERFTTSLTLTRDQYNSTDARSFERTSARANLNYLLSEKTSLDCELRYDNNTEAGGDDEDIRYLRITPGIVRKLTEDFSIRLAGAYSREVEDNEPGDETTAERYRTWVELTYQWPRFWATH